MSSCAPWFFLRRGVGLGGGGCAAILPPPLLLSGDTPHSPIHPLSCFISLIGSKWPPCWLFASCAGIRGRRHAPPDCSGCRLHAHARTRTHVHSLLIAGLSWNSLRRKLRWKNSRPADLNYLWTPTDLTVKLYLNERKTSTSKQTQRLMIKLITRSREI